MVSLSRNTLVDSDKETLETRGWLSSQPAAFRHAVLEAAQTFNLARGDVIYRLDDPPGGLYAVCEGFLDVLVAIHPDTPQFVHVARKGWWVGDAALITDTPRRAGLTARTEARIAYVPKEAMLRICGDNPDGWRHVAKLTVSMFDHALRIMSAQKLETPEDRVSATLLLLVGEGQLFGRGSEGEQAEFPLSQLDISDLTGLSRNAVGPVLRRLQTKGAIELGYRHFKIVDRRLL
ncbi:Crp/Fnr family transcriptional regulator [Defluviimonas sp. D31]|uniref:Crp/Fnr family transcriptional regulator n=1 Tax=Defluviimonas sp. D31 TaxID=3083253 RepID=UPI00296F7B3A|nr:Crp/Fnr family transcriptional regulator [Defluviimonas sp. D31]MDW4551501.1 Crp/Fnr family transcriptional regulator [Defluviimonas sp. D31]